MLVLLHLVLFILLCFGAYKDLKVREIPNTVVVFILVLAVLKCLIFHCLLKNIFVFLIISISMFIIYVISEYVKTKLLGEGDIKLLSALSLYFGNEIFIVVLLTCIFGFILGILKWLRNRGKFLETYVPLGPAVLLSTIMFIIMGW